MNTDLQALIEKKPHLKDPLALYEKVRQFCREAGDLLPSNGSALLTVESKAYPTASAGPVIQRFSAIFELPDGTLAPLKQALEVGDIDFTRLPLHEVPAFSLPYPEEDLATLLFLLSRPFFIKLRDECKLDHRFWDEGRCPVCAARPALSSVTEEPRRQMHCSYCGTSGYFTYIGCPICQTSEVSKLGTLIPEDEEGFRVVTCDSCGSYTKTVEGRLLNTMSPDLADMVSLPLDIVAQGKGYVRHAPNPIGLRKMI
jgi:FdhE protein